MGYSRLLVRTGQNEGSLQYRRASAATCSPHRFGILSSGDLRK